MNRVRVWLVAAALAVIVCTFDQWSTAVSINSGCCDEGRSGSAWLIDRFGVWGAIVPQLLFLSAPVVVWALRRWTPAPRLIGAGALLVLAFLLVEKASAVGGNLGLAAMFGH